MKIVFPEFENQIIHSAIQLCPEIKAIPAENLSDACIKLANGEAEGMVAGIDATTRDVILACRDHVPVKKKYFSSSFVLKKENKKLILADGGVCKNPNEEMLSQIVLQTAETAERVLTEPPKIAMLSFSTFGSGGKDQSIDLIRAVIARVRKLRPDLLIDGEMQLDAAINPTIARHKHCKTEVAGNANVLICPDLNSGNILYKGLEQLGDWTAAGPILQGFTKPIADLSRGSSVEDVVLVIKTLEKLI